MADKSKIEWTEASWNTIRARVQQSGRVGTGLDYKPGHEGKIDVFLDEKMLTQPLRWRCPRMIFVCSMTDLFADFVSDEMIDKMFAVMALCPQHTFQCLTKRPERMRAYMAPYCQRRADGLGNAVLALGYDGPLESLHWPPPNAWLGTSVEDQATADARIPELLATPAAVRWISAEPLLGPVDLTEGCNGHYFFNALRGTRWHDDPDGVPHYSCFPPIGRKAKPGVPAARLDWVVVGGESGPKARPMHPGWARSLRDQCQAAGVAFFFKQWGEWGPDVGPEEIDGDRIVCDRIMEGRARCAWWNGRGWTIETDGYAVDLAAAADSGEWVYRLGKKAAGRLLDGVEWNQFPECPV